MEYKDTMRVFNEIDNGKAGVLPQSKFVDFIENIEEGFHSEDMAGQLQKLYPNKSGISERFDFVRWHVDEEVYLDSIEEAEHLVGWG